MLVVLNQLMESRFGLTAADRRDFALLFSDPWWLVKTLLGHADVEITKRHYLAPVERFFDGFDLVEPGLVQAPFWRPDTLPSARSEAPAVPVRQAPVRTVVRPEAEVIGAETDRGPKTRAICTVADVADRHGQQ